MSKLIPKMYYESIYQIDYKKLKKNGVKCLLFDLDNTCIPYKEKEPTQELLNLIKKLSKMNFRVIIFTNAPKKRILPLISYNIECHHTSLKPFKINFHKIMKKYNYKKDDICIIGDQLFTDIYGGNRVGIKTILVDPLSNDDLIFTKILRFLEKQVIKKSNKIKKGEYYE